MPARPRPIGSRGARALVVAVAACFASLVALAADGATAPNGPRWGIRVVATGSYSSLMAADGSLYATRGRSSQLVRLDPRTGRIEAVATRATTADSVAFAGGSIWATGVPTARPSARVELVRFDARTLRRERTVVAGGGYKPFVFPGPHGQLWAGTGDSQLGACIIRRLRSSDGATLRSRRLHTAGTPAGGCSDAAFTPSGDDLFVITGSGGTANLVLYKLDARSLAVVAHRTLPSFAAFASVAASNTRVWLAGGTPGANGDLVFLDASSLRILAVSPDLGTDGSKVSDDLPEFSQWPDVTLAGGRVWVASDGTEACFSPSSRRTLAIYTEFRQRAIATAQLTELDGRLWALGQDASGTSGALVLVGPPPACTR